MSEFQFVAAIINRPYCRAGRCTNKAMCLVKGFRLHTVKVSISLAVLTLGVFATDALRASGTEGAAAVETRYSGRAGISLSLSACQLEDSAKVSSVEAQCGEFSVLENPADPTSRRIGLRVARVPAINRHSQPDPLFVLAGG